MSDVYVLASPSPTLFVYPSALHPVPPPPTAGGAPFRPYYPLPLRLDEDPTARRQDELALTLLGHP